MVLFSWSPLPTKAGACTYTQCTYIYSNCMLYSYSTATSGTRCKIQTHGDTEQEHLYAMALAKDWSSLIFDTLSTGVKVVNVFIWFDLICMVMLSSFSLFGQCLSDFRVICCVAELQNALSWLLDEQWNRGTKKRKEKSKFNGQDDEHILAKKYSWWKQNIPKLTIIEHKSTEVLKINSFGRHLKPLTS